MIIFFDVNEYLQEYLKNNILTSKLLRVAYYVELGLLKKKILNILRYKLELVNYEEVTVILRNIIVANCRFSE